MPLGHLSPVPSGADSGDRKGKHADIFLMRNCVRDLYRISQSKSLSRQLDVTYQCRDDQICEMRVQPHQTQVMRELNRNCVTVRSKESDKRFEYLPSCSRPTDRRGNHKKGLH